MRGPAYFSARQILHASCNLICETDQVLRCNHFVTVLATRCLHRFAAFICRAKKSGLQYMMTSRKYILTTRVVRVPLSPLLILCCFQIDVIECWSATDCPSRTLLVCVTHLSLDHLPLYVAHRVHKVVTLAQEKIPQTTMTAELHNHVEDTCKKTATTVIKYDAVTWLLFCTYLF